MSNKECNFSPAGWRCTRAWGHEGPCAAVPDESAQAKDYREQAVQDISTLYGCDADLLHTQMTIDPKYFCGNAEWKVEAVKLKERILQLEDELKRAYAINDARCKELAESNEALSIVKASRDSIWANYQTLLDDAVDMRQKLTKARQEALEEAVKAIDEERFQGDAIARIRALMNKPTEEV